MSWAVGYDPRGGRDIGYGVPALCDQPDCTEEIDRGLGYVCGGEPYGGEEGCGLYFCGNHLCAGEECNQLCDRCVDGVDVQPHEPKPDVPEWLRHKLNDPSWEQWRAEHPDEVGAIQASLALGPLTEVLPNA